MSSKSSRPPSFSQRRLSRTSLHSNRSLEQLEDNNNGLGSLADELGHAWDGDGDEDDYQDQEEHSNFLEGLREGVVEQDPSMRDLHSPYALNDMHDFGFGMVMQSPLPTQQDAPSPMLHVPQPRRDSEQRDRRKLGHQRHESAYDGSDYGPDSDLEEPDEGLPPILRKRIRDLEHLTRLCINPEDAVSEGGGTVRRTIHGLKELGPQGNIEYGVTRLITAYTSMASHRTNKTRDIFTQSHSLLYGGMLNLPEEMLDLLLDEVNELISTIPFLRQQNPLLSLQILASQTDELGQTLRSITDLLQEFKLAANTASRKLKTVRDQVDDMSVEEELVENSIMLIQAGDWDRRCRTRQAAKTCQEICEGFATRWGLDFDADLAQRQTHAKSRPALQLMVSG